MNPPRLEAVYFGDGAGHQWPRLARVLEYSARQHCPDWTINVRELQPAKVKGHQAASESHLANTQKLQAWVDIVSEAHYGDRILLIDADTMILRPLDPIWERTFDVCYTARAAGVKLPMNAGVLFIQVSAWSQLFMETWWQANQALLTDAKVHQVWRKKFGGMNQAAFGKLLEGLDPASKFVAADNSRLQCVPCQMWNCEDSCWPQFDPAITRIVHVKSALRRAVFGLGPKAHGLYQLVTLWKRLETEALLDTLVAAEREKQRREREALCHDIADTAGRLWDALAPRKASV